MGDPFRVETMFLLSFAAVLRLFTRTYTHTHTHTHARTHARKHTHTHTQKPRERFWENAGEWTWRMAISSRKKSLSVDEACMAVF